MQQMLILTTQKILCIPVARVEQFRWSRIFNVMQCRTVRYCKLTSLLASLFSFLDHKQPYHAIESLDDVTMRFCLTHFSEIGAQFFILVAVLQEKIRMQT